AARAGVLRMNVATGAVSTVWEDSDGVEFLALTGDGRLSVSGQSFFHRGRAYNQEVQLRQADTGQTLLRWPTHGPYLNGVAVTTDGRLVAATCGSQLYLWDTEDPKRDTTREIDARHYFTGLAFSPDGRLLAVGRNDRTLYLWDTANCE